MIGPGLGTEMQKCDVCGSERFEEFAVGHSSKKYKRFVHEKWCRKFVPVRRRGVLEADAVGED